MTRIFFYGEECPHCEKMHALVDAVVSKGIQIEKREVWHNDANMKILESFDKEGECGGVPFFVNTDSGKTICGEAKEEELEAWAK